MNPTRSLLLLDATLAVCRLGRDADVPAWAAAGPLSSITRTAEELSVVCAASAVPAGVRAERGWRALRVAGTLDFGLVGVLAGLTCPLADAGISVFAVSTFDTDYLLVRAADLGRACATLAGAGWTIIDQGDGRDQSRR